METLSITGKAAHSKGIYREAIRLQNEDWYVMANHIPGFLPPPEFEGCIPDIYAIKEEQSMIIVIVTSQKHNLAEVAALKSYSGHYSNIEFYCWQVNEAGCRVSIIE
jgi:hypothetical protein